MQKRAAEACAWLENEDQIARDDLFMEIYQKLVNHPEKSIREASQRSWDERRVRKWAEDYLNRILSIQGKTNEEILDSWCYGDALMRVGDDTCISTLEEHVSKYFLPPNLEYWLLRIIGGMKENWKKTIKEWPETPYNIRGAIEQSHGTLLSPDGKSIKIQYLIWQKGSLKANEKPGWGGIYISDETLPVVENGKIELDDSRQGNIIITSSSRETGIFVGNGEYPKQSA
ncbi:MAG: hypothetical protein EXR62_18790 [Chloroflexi bacterium]|nr:hypothetical protein [Chloroflexota bacterium]